MQIFVRQSTGIKTLHISSSTYINELHDELSTDSIYYNGRPLRGGFTLEDYGIMNNATLESLGQLLGGGKKRKKKVHTTPKKKKHVHKQVKLAVLQHYKVDGSGKVTRTKLTCEKCGQGVFMAKHFDRHYCGKCHATVTFDS